MNPVSFGVPVPIAGWVNCRRVTIHGHTAGYLYGRADNPATPNRPTSYHYRQLGTHIMHDESFDRIETARERIAHLHGVVPAQASQERPKGTDTRPAASDAATGRTAPRVRIELTPAEATTVNEALALLRTEYADGDRDEHASRQQITARLRSIDDVRHRMFAQRGWKP